MTSTERLHAFDAVRAFALLSGVVLHAGFSFIPGISSAVWAVADNSPSTSLSVLVFALHTFRMSLFFFVAGVFGRMMYHRSGARGFWANRARRILVPAIVGWMVLAPALAAVWVWGLTISAASGSPLAPQPRPRGAFPLTHLWFLYYLLLLYAGVTLARSVFLAIDRRGSLRLRVDALLERVVQSGAAAPVLAVPLALALSARADWVMWFGIPTPDNSIIPQATSLVAYGAAMTFGWLVHRRREVVAAWARQWHGHLVAALAATAACLWIADLAPSFTPARKVPSTFFFAASYAVAAWSWSFAVLGFALRFLVQPVPALRYVADASYWIYLVHLPVVVGLQVAVARLPWHWMLKFPLVVLITLAFSLLSYHVLVRSTIIGQVLNGRRHVGFRAAPSNN